MPGSGLGSTVIRLNSVVAALDRAVGRGRLSLIGWPLLYLCSLQQARPVFYVPNPYIQVILPSLPELRCPSFGFFTLKRFMLYFCSLAVSTGLTEGPLEMSVVR